MKIIEEIKEGNRRAIAKAISGIENNTELGKEILAQLEHIDLPELEHTDMAQLEHEGQKAYTIGITGPPGAGKSTLINQLAKKISEEGKRVGIIAVDPSSPITGGALLGDRVRMTELTSDRNIYIRSMAARGALGGIAKAVEGTLKVLNAASVDYILLETVGVGQSEVDVKRVADLVLFVTVPGLGDDIQAEKAGVVEIADIIVLNKADREDADHAMRYLQSALRMSSIGENNGQVPVIKTIATAGTGIDDLLIEIRGRKL